MAKPVEGMSEKILACAKAEFLEKGFAEASLRTIAQNAQTSTGSIYSRFGDKNGLLEALVAPVVDELRQWFGDMQEEFNQMPNERKSDMVHEYGESKMDQFVDYVYRHYDTFKLLVHCAEGSPFSEFVHDLAKIDTEYTVKYLVSIGNKALASGRITKDLIHIISSAFFSGLFEVVVHDMSKAAADVYCDQLTKFFRAGWETILNRE